jgi:hypothetical protein
MFWEHSGSNAWGRAERQAGLPGNELNSPMSGALECAFAQNTMKRLVIRS